jgi:hypothetical protein
VTSHLRCDSIRAAEHRPRQRNWQTREFDSRELSTGNSVEHCPPVGPRPLLVFILSRQVTGQLDRGVCDARKELAGRK